MHVSQGREFLLYLSIGHLRWFGERWLAEQKFGREQKQACLAGHESLPAPVKMTTTDKKKDRKNDEEKQAHGSPV